MEIFAFDLSDKWIEVNDSVKFRVDYLKPDQAYKLNVMLRKGVDFKIEYHSKLTNPDLPDELDGFPNTENLTDEQTTKLDAAWQLYKDFYLKYVIKDFVGVKDKDGKEVKCLLVNDELDNKLWTVLCSQKNLKEFLFTEAFMNVLRWNDIDKKKSLSEEDSNTKAD